VRIEIFSDVVCPWCYIGTHRLSRAIAAVVAEGGDAPDIEMRPFQLDPAAPDFPSPVLESYAKRFGDRAPELLGRVTDVARADGLDLRFDRALRANTRRAHLLLEHALAEAGPTAQWALSDLLFRAYFEEGADLGDSATLIGLAQSVGISGAEGAIAEDQGRLDAALRAASDRGVTAVPTFVVDGQWSIPGAQDVETFLRILRRLSA
jgi:predicted DsbA family dithiol-disulfide isomerase